MGEKEEEYLVAGKWFLEGYTEGNKKPFEYEMDIIQDGDRISGSCTTGFTIEGSMDSKGNLSFQQKFGISSSSTVECECTRIANDSYQGKWSKPYSKQTGTFELSRE